MPELPEVETIVRRLKTGCDDHPSVCGEIIDSIEIHWDRIIASPSPGEFITNLQGKQISDACRRGKYLHFPLDYGHLMGHLRMSGEMRMEAQRTPSGTPIPIHPYDRVIFNFTSSWRMVFSSIRKFGRMWYSDDPQTVFRNLGPEPLSAEMTATVFFEMLHSHKRQIKPLLMDQSFLAGMGNIYTDESLFIAKIHPLRKSDSLTQAEVNKLFKAIQSTLKTGIRRFGASVDWVYRGGQFQNYFNVYQQKDKPCPECGTAITKLHVGQRGTHICPTCQVLS